MHSKYVHKPVETENVLSVKREALAISDAANKLLEGRTVFGIDESTLKSLAAEEIRELTSRIPTVPRKVKLARWKEMDTGIYDEQGNLIGDKCWEEDAYEE